MSSIHKHLSKILLSIIIPLITYCYICNFKKLNVDWQRILLHYATDGEDSYVRGNCFIIKTTMTGRRQWGNGMYYYMSSIMYLLRKGAIYVIIPTVKGKNPIGAVNLDGVAYGPKASLDFDQSTCSLVDPREIWTGGWGTMWDFMNFRNEFDSMSKDWPKGPKMNQNPFVSDFGVYPSAESVVSALDVIWEEVLVIHIRQGDVMYYVNSPMRIFWHSQPPCSYYEDVIETGYDGQPFPHVLIITNKIPDKNPLETNPCDQYLEDKYSSGYHTTNLLNYDMISNRLVTKHSHAGHPYLHVDLRKDLHILSEAVNVAEGHSTFTMGTTMLNYKLKRHFFPAAPATINTVQPVKRTMDGLLVYTRQFYSEKVEQTLYVLNGWLGFDGSCDAYAVDLNHPIHEFHTSAKKQAEEWKDTNFTEKLLSYDRSLIVKFKTRNEPFKCETASVIVDNPSWFFPCVCNSVQK